MSLFTRKERNQQLAKGKLVKYITYAIGEILLIVVGVLLAVMINTKVADSKNRAAIKNIYLRLYEDLGEDIKKADQLLRYYALKDSLIYEVMNDLVTEEDYLNVENYRLRSLVITYEVLEIQDQSFKSIMALNNKVTLKQDSVFSKIKLLYFDKKSSVERNNAYITNMVIGNIDWIKFNTSWFSNFYFMDRPPTATEIEFYLKNDIYRNLVTEYSQTGPGNHVRSVLSYRKSAGQLYAELGNYLDIENTSIYDGAQYEQFIGRYSIEENSLEVVVKDAQLYLEQTGYSEQIIPLSSNCFTTSDGGFYYITQNSSQQVTGLQVRYGGSRYNLQKQMDQ